MNLTFFKPGDLRGPVRKSRRDETLAIPQEAHGRPLTSFPVSLRLKHVLEYMQFRLLGDLHGHTLSEFSGYRNCGRKTLDELRALVRAIRHEHLPAAEADQTDAAVPETPPPIAAQTFSIPVSLHHLSIVELPLSARLDRALRRKGVHCLGDLQGVSLGELRAIGNCGMKSILELACLIERAETGEFEVPSTVAWDPGELVRTLDTLVAALPDRNQEILLLRLGGRSEEVPTLEEVGARFKRTRERVRQIVALGIKQIRKSGSRRLRSYLEQVSRVCCDAVCPLTPGLLGLWLKPPPAAGRFRFGFYVRLLGGLSGAIPAWPAGWQTSASQRGRSAVIEREMEAVLRERLEAAPLTEALMRLRARPNLRDLEAIEFLSTLHHSRRLIVEFPKPDAAVVRLPRRSALDVAKAVLQASDSPLTPEEILARARSIVGAGVAWWKPCTLAKALVEENGFYRLGPRTYATRFTLPRAVRRRVRANIRNLLKQQNRPLSAAEVVTSRRFNWSEHTNAYELASILRQDVRLVDLGRFRFALAEWGTKRASASRGASPKRRNVDRPASSKKRRPSQMAP